MKYNPYTRRHFLQGLGGSLLALPLLPSLMPRAHAQATTADPRFLVIIPSGHGGFGGSTDWYPRAYLESGPTPFTDLQIVPASAEAPAHIARHAMLNQLLSADPAHPNGDVDSGQQRISYILGSFMNPYLSKMNFYAGMDGALSYYGHSGGVYGGHIWHDSKEKNLIWPTVDRFLAASPKIYPSRCDISVPVYNLTGGASRTETGGAAPSIGNNVSRLYQTLFEKFDPNKTADVKTRWQRRELVMDRVIEEYRRVTRGAFGPARQISSDDKARLEEHVQHLHEVQCRYKEVINSCSSVSGPNENISVGGGGTVTEHARRWELAIDLMAAAFQCGATRLGVMEGNIHWTYAGDVHQQVIHLASADPAKQLLRNSYLRWEAEFILAKVCEKLEARTALNGKSVLDQSLVAWVHEAGESTHSQFGIGLVTVGSMGGFFKTGQFVDFRNRQNTRLGSNRHPGMPMHRMWANMLLGMGITPEEFERYGRKGYGDTSKNAYSSFSNRQHAGYPTNLLATLSDRLPIVT